MRLTPIFEPEFLSPRKWENLPDEMDQIVRMSKWYTPSDAHTIQLIKHARVSLSGTKSDTVQEDSRWLMYLSENGLSADVKRRV